MTYKRVYIMGVDGAGRFFDSTPTPNLDRIFADGAITYNMTTARPTISAQCWGSMFHGVDADRHRLNNGIASQNVYANHRFPSFMKVIRDAMPDAALASFCCWNPINVGIVEEGIGVVKEGGWDDVLTDKVCGYLEDNDPNVLFVHFDSVDSKGHAHGYNTPEHLSQITVVDGMIDRIYKKAEEKGYTEDMLFIVTADHGGTPPDDRKKGYHGGDSDAEKICFLGAAGKTVRKGLMGECNIKDIASITLAAFGLEQPETWTSRVPENFFTDIAGGKERPVEPDFEPPKARLHKNVPTPEDSVAVIESIIGKIKAYYPFDGHIKDVKGGHDFDYDGKIYFPEGYHGSCCSLYDTRIFNCMSFGSEALTVACWIKMDPPPVRKIVFSNLVSDENGLNRGFCVILEKDCISAVFYDENGKKNRNTVPYPENEYDGWFHLAVILDRKKRKTAIYTDFKKIGENAVTESLMNGASLNGGVFSTGEGGMAVSLDELIITPSALTEEQVNALGEYYGI